MLRKLFFLVAILLCLREQALSDDQADLAAIREFPNAAKASALAFSTGFDKPEDAARKYPPGFRVVAAEGRNGTAGLFYERTDPNAYPLCTFPLKNLLPEKNYTVSAWVRAEDLKAVGDSKNIGAMCVEYSKEGKWVSGGVYYSANAIDADWQRIEMTFRTPLDVKTGLQPDLKFYLRQKITGKIWFDDVEVRETTLPVAVVLTRPDRLSFFGDNGKFSLRMENAVAKNIRVAAVVKNAEKTSELLLKPDDLDFHGDVGKLEPGPVEIATKIVDMEKKVVLGEETFNLVARPEATAPPNACTIDEFGRAIVDGKPFMPLGVFGFAGEKNYERLKDAGFNCVQLYASLELKGNVDHKDPIKNVQEGLDLIDKHGLKLVFSLKDQLSNHPNARKKWGGVEGIDAVSALAVETVKDHPALLAWYISDEEMRKDVPLVVDLRRLVSKIDPWHPTWTLTYRYEDLPYYGVSGDTIGVDPYPIVNKPIEEQSIKLVKTAMTAGNSTGLPVWAVPQIFNWSVYRLKDDPKAAAESHFPTVEEMRAMALYAGMLGAKGFVFYSNFDICQRYDKILPGSGEREWPKVVEMVKSVKELEPFVLSTKKPLEIAVESEPKDAVEAGVLLDDNGNFRVIVIGTGGKAKGVFTLPEAVLRLKKETLRSKFGKTKPLGENRYEFSVDAVDSDVLE